MLLKSRMILFYRLSITIKNNCAGKFMKFTHSLSYSHESWAVRILQGPFRFRLRSAGDHLAPYLLRHQSSHLQVKD